ncbi:LamB/YcsF family protein [Apodospora peruviana]|uniref:LamB/YcsF family protein n=1 Tax=Apodospora peruviana TaxID=516989 RepID=A0AAE0HWY1_9PEZI|nr:LamB/YcsF family protein [Apodospora peruviana]
MAAKRIVLVNCDMGEGLGPWKMGPDEDLMPLVDQANIACGFHAGDPTIMMRTVKLAKKHGVAVGAHPGLPDKEGFGRRLMDIPPEDLYCQVLYQVGALQTMLAAEGMKLNHIKPHGKLYRMIKDDPKVGDACMRAIKTFGVPFIGLPGTAHEELCKEHGIEFMAEFFPDLWYDDEGQTVPILPKMDKIIATEMVTSINGNEAKVPIGGRTFTCCIHSDLPGALVAAQAARAAVDEAGAGAGRK